MSRNYDVQVEVFPWPAGEEANLGELLSNWGMHIDDHICCANGDDEESVCFWGSIEIGGDLTAEDRHEELRALLAQCELSTSWRWVDELPWDDTFFSYPDEPSTEIEPAPTAIAANS